MAAIYSRPHFGSLEVLVTQRNSLRSPFKIICWAAFICLIIVSFVGILSSTVSIARHGRLDQWSFLEQRAGFVIGQTFVQYRPDNTVAWALLTGTANTLVLSAASLTFATLLGFVVGIAKISDNPAVRLLALCYTELLRSVPLLLWLFFWYALFLAKLPPARSALEFLPHAYLSNEGLSLPSIELGLGWLGVVSGIVAIGWSFGLHRQSRARRWLLWAGIAAIILTFWRSEHTFIVPVRNRFRIEGGFRLTTEFAAMLVGLSLSASATVAEIVRAGFGTVSKGQLDAARALGFTWLQSLRFIILPQAAGAIGPPLTSSYAGLIKASSLAVAIGFPDLVMVANTVINQTGQALECTAIYTLVYLSISILVASIAQKLVGKSGNVDRYGG